MTPVSYNQISLPSFMYGTAWKKEATARLVELAVETGFKAIDTANQLKHYDEALVGEALKSLQNKGFARESLFLQTKFTPVDGQDHRLPYDASASLTMQVRQSMDSSLKHLHADYLDAYLLHGPYSRHGLGAEDFEVWAALEELHAAGKTRMIGISNVTAEQLRQLCQTARIKPMVVQNRCYAITGWDSEVRDICRSESIIYQGFSLLTANAGVLSEQGVRTIARRLSTGVAQVIFRFAIEIGMLPLTGTTSEQHMREDLEAEKLDLSPEDIRLIETIGVAGRYR